MNIRRTIKMLSIVGAGLTVGATFMPGTANSAAPSFDSWTATGGTITGCPSGFTCSNLVTGDGFRQAQVTNSTTGDSFVWTVVTDTGATSTSGQTGAGSVPFSDENFVVTSNNNSTGVADKQSISDTTNGDFNSTVNVLTGFAAPTANQNVVQINQSLNKGSGTTTAFETSFNMTVALDSAGNQLGKSMNIGQVTNLNSTTDHQTFVARDRSGTFLQDASGTSLTLGTAAPVSWTAGTDDVMLTWVGQGLTLGGLGASQFGYEGITNNTTTATASTFSQAVTGPFVWPSTNGNTDFGTQPTY